MFVRGIFFLTRYTFGMSDGQNLILALVSGLTYVVGAQLSHYAGEKFSAKKVMMFLISVQIISPSLCFFYNSFPSLCFLFPLFAMANGMTWPFAESYASAGLDEKESSSSIGIYNISWSSAVPAGVWVSGWIISASGKNILMTVALTVFVAMLVAIFLPKRIPHLTVESGETPPNRESETCPDAKAMMLSGRWSMCFSYALIQLLSSLLPGRFYELGISVGVAGFVAGFVDMARILAFIWMSQTHCWHGKRSILFICSPVLSLGFVLCMFSDKIWMILAGEMIFGIAAALSYYAALYYAMVIGNAQVGAGGSHETVIGAGFLAGPLAGIGANQIALTLGMTLISGPVIAIAVMSAIFIPMSIKSLCVNRKA